MPYFTQAPGCLNSSHSVFVCFSNTQFSIIEFQVSITALHQKTLPEFTIYKPNKGRQCLFVAYTFKPVQRKVSFLTNQTKFFCFSGVGSFLSFSLFFFFLFKNQNFFTSTGHWFKTLYSKQFGLCYGIRLIDREKVVS